MKKPSYQTLKNKIETLEDSVKMIDSLKAEIELNNSFLEMLFNTIPNPIFYKDKDGIYINCNDSFSQNILGLAKNEIIGKSLYDFPEKIPKENADIYYKKDMELLEKTGTQSYTACVKCANGTTCYYNFYKATFMSNEGKPLGIIGIMLDITELKKEEEKLKFLASIDSMTKLFNRRHFYEISEPILNLAKRNNMPISVMMLDVDNFKKINDTYGHKIGDDVLIKLADKLQKTNRKSDIIARWGGEEFLILLPETDLKGACKIAEKIRRTIENLSIKTIDNKNLNFTLSIGVYQCKDKANISLDNLIQKVDTALYKAKKNGKNQVYSE